MIRVRTMPAQQLADGDIRQAVIKWLYGKPMTDADRTALHAALDEGLADDVAGQIREFLHVFERCFVQHPNGLNYVPLPPILQRAMSQPRAEYRGPRRG